MALDLILVTTALPKICRPKSLKYVAVKTPRNTVIYNNELSPLPPREVLPFFLNKN